MNIEDKLEELKTAHNIAKNSFLDASIDVATARIAASDAKATRYDGSEADKNIDIACGKCIDARVHMFNTAKALDAAIDYKEKD